MADTTKIEWTATNLPDGRALPGYTFNPWTGCTKVSPGCDHCYAEGWSKRSGHVEWGPHGARRRTSAANWAKPLKWNAEAEATGIRRKVFCASLADVFDNHQSIADNWRADLWELIRSTPHLDWLLLTKRPQNIAKMLPDRYNLSIAGSGRYWGTGWPNVWLGTTVENQTEAERRIPHLLAVPAAVRFLSVEPMLGRVDLRSIVPNFVEAHFCTVGCTARGDEECCKALPGIDWVICGGESGPGARPMHPDWARSLRDQCQAAGVPFFFKQWGEWAPAPANDGEWPTHLPGFRRMNVEGRSSCDGWPMQKVGKRAAGRALDGCECNEMPGGAA